MTTILKAVQEIEERTSATKRAAVAPTEERQAPLRRALPWLLVASTVSVFGGIALLSLRSAVPPVAAVPRGAVEPRVAVEPRIASEPRVGSERVASERPPINVAAPNGAQAESADAAPARADVGGAAPDHENATANDAPWGHVEKRAVTAVAPPPAPAAPRPLAESRPRAPQRRVDTPADDTPHEAASQSAGGVRVMSIAYSPDAAARSAALRVGGRSVTLHEGEAASGYQVQLILPHVVYVRSGREIFAVDAAP